MDGLTGEEISTHALREEGDEANYLSLILAMQFLPTPSARRATLQHHRRAEQAEISTHALREEGDRLYLQGPLSGPISTHALREEGDMSSPTLSWTACGFLPTPSARRATTSAGCTRRPAPISTHALREEGDRSSHWGPRSSMISTHALREEGDGRDPVGRRRRRNFYPRPPRGGRPVLAASARIHEVISTHALREEGDWRSEWDYPACE